MLLWAFLSMEPQSSMMTCQTNHPPKWHPKIGLLTAHFIDSPMSCFYCFWDIKVFLRYRRNITFDTILIGIPFKHHLITLQKENSDGLLTLLVCVLALSPKPKEYSSIPLSSELKLFHILQTSDSQVQNPVKHIV
jgi:hypothetical protein